MRNESHFNKKYLPLEMPKEKDGIRNFGCKSRRCRIVCKFCGNTLTKNEEKLHFYVCVEIPKEIFNNYSFQDTLWR